MVAAAQSAEVPPGTTATAEAELLLWMLPIIQVGSALRQTPLMVGPHVMMED